MIGTAEVRCGAFPDCREHAGDISERGIIRYSSGLNQIFLLASPDLTKQTE
jgi:hypothetical protein